MFLDGNVAISQDDRELLPQFFATYKSKGIHEDEMMRKLDFLAVAFTLREVF